MTTYTTIVLLPNSGGRTIVIRFQEWLKCGQLIIRTSTTPHKISRTLPTA